MTEDIKSAGNSAAKSEKMTDKTFMKFIVTAISAILVCATGLVSTTWAWYTSTLSSADNKINSATFEIELSIVNTETGVSVEVVDSTVDYYSLEKGTYTVTVNRTADSTATAGYAIITDLSNDTNKHYTAALTSSLTSLTFTIEAKRDTAITVGVKSNWGSPAADELLSNGKTLTLN